MTTPPPASGSLKLRFMLIIGLWVGLGVTAIWLAATQVFTRHIEQSYHDELEVHVRELARLTELDETGAPRLMRPLSDPRYEEPLSGFYWEVTVPHHAPLKSQSMTRGGLEQQVAHSPDIAHQIERGPTGPAITYGMTERGPAGEVIHVVIATDRRLLDEDIADFTRDLSWWLGGLAALLLGTGLASILFAMKPLDRLGRAVNALRGGKAQMLEGRYPVEIAPLVGDLNAYIDQTGELVARGRVQAGNLAHSLRTPLAVITDEAERMAAEPATSASATVLLDQAERMQQQIDYQLARARSAATARLPGSVADLPELLGQILGAMRRLYPQVTFATKGLDGPVSVPVDPVNLSELLSILIDNAAKWAQERVEIGYAFDGEHALLTVADDGPGMTGQQIARACEIGTRFDPAKPGSGLGLAMAADIAQTIDVALDLRRGDVGLVASLRLPAPVAR